MRIALSVVALSAAAFAQVQPDAVLMRMPDVSKDQIVFRYANDLWLVAKEGGTARPLASPEGPESLPKFSPDGARIAFMGGYDGGTDLYVVAVDGGIPQRVTHHPAAEVLCDWTADGKSLLFFSAQSSGQQRAPKMFKVAANGGQPEELPIPYGTFGVVDDTASWLAYTPVAQSEFRTWKRYQGGLAQDVWLFNLVSFESRRVTDHPGTDSLPMWHGHELYFLSDRDPKARLNLWMYDVQKRTTVQVTDFTDADVRFSSIGPDDIVFEHAGKLFRYDLAAQKSLPVAVAIPGDRPLLRAQTLSLEQDIASVRIGPNAKRVAIEARGEIFSAPVDEGALRNLTASSGVAERSPAWSCDGQWIAYWSDRSGEYELCVRRADGAPFKWNGAEEETSEKALTTIGAGWKYEPAFAPDSKSVAFTNNSGELWHLTLASGDLKKLATNPLGEPFDIDWAPDSRWITWSQRHSTSQLNTVLIYDLTKGELHEIGAGRFENRAPSFDRGGEWLYFVSQRTFTPSYSDFDDSWIYTDAANLMAVALRKDVVNPFLARDASESESDEDATASDESSSEGEGEGEGKKADKDKAAPKPIEIDFDGLEGRILQLPVANGSLSDVHGGDACVFYLRRERAVPSDDDEPAPSGAKLVQFKLSEDKKEREEKLVLAGVAAFEMAAKGEKLFVALADGGYAVIDAKPEQKVEDKLDFHALEASVTPRDEWQQILADAHRLVRDFFYESTLHNVDWNGVYEHSKRVLADATSRDDLHYVLSEMIAELNIGHAYNQGGPGIPEKAAEGRAAGLLGCDWTFEQGAYRIARIIGAGSAEPDARGPLAQPGIDAREGDWLLAVNGAAPLSGADVQANFLGTVDRPTELVLNQQPTRDGNERRVMVRPIAGESEVRYRDWVEHNRLLVDQLSAGRIAYVHVPDTGLRGQNELVRQYVGQFHKDALLVDERWNSGGQIPTRFIELLNRPRTNFWALRHGDDWMWPPFAHHGPKAMLINGSSGSGGDAFPYYFRQMKLGALIGRRTWGGLVGISGNPSFVDGSSITVPRFAFYEKDGTWGVEGYGVAPDIEVIDDPALMVHGEDPQLVAGVQHLLHELETFAFERANRPASPDRKGAGVTPADR